MAWVKSLPSDDFHVEPVDELNVLAPFQTVKKMKRTITTNLRKRKHPFDITHELPFYLFTLTFYFGVNWIGQ